MVWFNLYIQYANNVYYDQIDSITIDGNIECVQLYSDVTIVNSVFDFVSDKIVNNSDNFRINCLSYSKISAILSVLYFLFFHTFI